MTDDNDAATLQQDALATLRRHKQRAMHVGEIRGKLGLDRSAQDALFRALEALAEARVVTQLPGGRFRVNKPGASRQPGKPPSNDRRSAKDQTPSERESRGRRRDRGSDRRGRRQDSHDARTRRTGVLTVNARGFGFVSPQEPGPDVFVPATGLGTAMHGDTVVVRVRPSAKGLEGRVEDITARGTTHVSGQLHVTSRGAFIESDDDRMRHRVELAKVPAGAKTGTAVIARVLRFPERDGEPVVAEVVEQFSARELVAFETRRVLVREGIQENFSDEAAAEADAFPTSVPAKDKKDRVDLRPLDLITIDPDDAKDHDDAVFAERLPGGGFRVIVAIADVSHYVKPGSPLDVDALARGCTLYLPSRSIPMLPEALSSNLASLVPKRDRLALAVDVELGPAGAVRKVKLLEAVIRSQARLTYEGVARALGLTEKGPRQPAAAQRLPHLQTLLDVAEVLGKKRKRRGSLEFDLPEAKVRLDEETGRPVDVVRSRQDEGVRLAYNMIEELALLANEVVAAELTRRKLPTIYRIHPTPDEDRLEAFAELATSLGHELSVDDAKTPKRLSRFLSKIEDTPQAGTLRYLLLRAMQQATYDTSNLGHFGLAAKEYLHFTSPIRRYPDIAVHRLVRKLARGQRIHTKGLRELLDEQAQSSSKLERRAMQVERDVVDLYRAMLMQDRVGDVFEATITGIADHGVYCALDAPFVDVLCRLASLPPDDWEPDNYGIRLTGLRTGRSFALGQRLSVRIEEVSLTRRRIAAVPVLPSRADEDDRGTPGRRRGRKAPSPREPRRTQSRAESKQRDRERNRRQKEKRRGDKKKQQGRKQTTRRRKSR